MLTRVLPTLVGNGSKQPVPNITQNTLILHTIYNYTPQIFVTGFAKPSLRAHLVFREILILNIKVTVVHLCYNVAMPDTQYK